MRILRTGKLQLTRLFNDFFHSEKSAGLLLLGLTIASMLVANSSFSDTYLAIWNKPLGSHTTAQWINDGLMAIFFLLIGLELEREIYAGELKNWRTALLPATGALGGIIVPAAIFMMFNYGTPTQDGVGIPMATDIAFALAVLSILGNRIPTSLKIFLTALAVIDDLCAIIVIAVFYTQTIVLLNLFVALGIFGILLALNRAKVHAIWVYLVGGVVMWYFMLNSGVHATITGVLLAFALPFGDGSEQSPSYKLQHFLHKPVAFIILPIFAIANTAITIPPNWHADLFNVSGLGIILGLVVGKPLGIMIFSSIAVFMKWCTVPEDLDWKHLLGAGMLAGIGFTMSIFITLLAFDDPELITGAKIATLTASIFASVAGVIWLFITGKSVEKAS